MHFLNVKMKFGTSNTRYDFCSSSPYQILRISKFDQIQNNFEKKTFVAGFEPTTFKSENF